MRFTHPRFVFYFTGKKTSVRLVLYTGMIYLQQLFRKQDFQTVYFTIRYFRIIELPVLCLAFDHGGNEFAYVFFRNSLQTARCCLDRIANHEYSLFL